MSSMCSILIAGDLVPIDRVADLFDKKRYSEVFGQVKAFTQDCDYSIVNLEAPVVETKGCHPIKKSGPCLKTNSSVTEALKYAGFDAVTLANNHFRDYGSNGCIDTFKALRDANVGYVGGGLNAAEAQYAVYQCLTGGGGNRCN